MFNSEPKLFSIGTISLPLETLEIIVVNTMQLKRIIETIDCRAKSYYNLKGSVDNKLEVNLKDKVYPETYYHHTLGQMYIVETLTKV